MSQTTYQVTLSTSGRHTVSVTSDEVTDFRAALAWAKATCDQLIAGKDSKPEQQPEGGEQVSGEEEARVCPVHNQPMSKQKGRYGFFWSCHQRNEDGSFCSYRPNER